MKYPRILKKLSLQQLKDLVVAKKRMTRVFKLERERKRLARLLARVDRKIAKMSGDGDAPRKTRKISAAGRRRMAAAQKRRWEKYRAAAQ